MVFNAGKLKEVRESKHLTVTQMASKMVMATQQYSLIESGASVPTIKTINRIAAALGVKGKIFLSE